MRIVVYVLFGLESLTLLLQLVAEHHIKVFSLVRCSLVPYAVLIELWVVSVLYIVAGMVSVLLCIYTSLNKVVVKLVDKVELALKVNHRTSLTLLVYEVESRDICIFSYLCVIRTKCRSDVHDTSTIVCCNIVAKNYTESFALHLNKLVASILTSEHLLGVSCGVVCNKLRSKVIHLLTWFNPRHELFVVHTFKLCALVMACNSPRTQFLLLVKRSKFALSTLLLRLQISLHKILCHNESHRLAVVKVVCLNRNIVNLWTNTECNV